MYVIYICEQTLNVPLIKVMQNNLKWAFCQENDDFLPEIAKYWAYKVIDTRLLPREKIDGILNLFLNDQEKTQHYNSIKTFVMEQFVLKLYYNLIMVIMKH